MLPYTAYNIPEPNSLLTPQTTQWLWVVTKNDPSEEDQDLLAKITSALNADMSKDVFLCQIRVDELLSIADIQGSTPRLVISFGVEPSAMGLWIDLPKPGIVSLEHFTFIRTQTLQELARSTSLKQQLWGAMKAFLEKQS